MNSKESNNNEKEFPTIIQEKLKKNNSDCQIKTYVKGPLLGKGGFAKVYEVTMTETNETVACKIIPKERVSKSRARQKLMSEIKIHKHLKHENIVKFIHYFEDEDNLYIILELCRNHSLREVLKRRKRITELETQCYMSSIINALIYLQSHRIIHRDIKLANIFIDENMEVKLGDFGLAAKLEFDGERKKTICGTPNYIAPEILEGKCGHSYECDVWSLGVLMYLMLVGKPPYETKDVKLTYRRIKMNLYSFPEKIKISDEAKSLIAAILVLDYTKRPTLTEILNHDFFTKNSIPKYLPQTALVIPPTSHFIQRYENKGFFLNLRASSQDNKTDPVTPTSPKRLRPVSKDSKRPNEKKELKSSSYLGGDENGPEIWVVNWIDLSKKYGLGYLLSNHCVGAVFNDNSHMIADSSFNSIQYISDDQAINYKIDDYPNELHKKVMLLNLFKKQFIYTEIKRQCSAPLIFVKKWAFAPHAFVFRISSKIVQICFRDGTELLLSSESKRVTYVNKSHLVESYGLNEAMESGNKEMTKRIKYSKEVLIRMIKQED